MRHDFGDSPLGSGTHREGSELLLGPPLFWLCSPLSDLKTVQVYSGTRSSALEQQGTPSLPGETEVGVHWTREGQSWPVPPVSPQSPTAISFLPTTSGDPRTPDSRLCVSSLLCSEMQLSSFPASCGRRSFSGWLTVLKVKISNVQPKSFVSPPRDSGHLSGFHEWLN